MKKIGILLDSSSGLTKKQAKSMGFYFVPILVEFNGKEYRSGVDINNSFLIKNMEPSSNVFTAAITLGELKEQFDNALLEVEELIFISLSKHLSSINSTAKILAKQYNGKVHVYDSRFITPWINSLIPELKDALKKQKTKEEIFEILDSQKDNMLALLAPSTLDFLYKGGRITKAQYFAGNLLKIKPIIFVRNGAINTDEVIKTRTLAKTYEKMIEIAKIEAKKFENENWKIEIRILTMDNKDNVSLFKKKLEDKNIKKTQETFLSTEIIAHVGPKAVGIGIFRVPIEK